MKSRFLSLVCTIVAVAALAQLCRAETTGSIVGAIRNAKAEPVAGAKLEAIGQQTAEHRTAVSGADGAFTFAQVPPDTYQINTSCDKCSDSSTTVIVGVGQQRSVEIAINTDSASTLVAIDTDATTLDQNSARIGANITSDEIFELPVNGRTYAPLALAAPGAFNSGGASFGDVRFQGQSIEQNRFLLDGIDASSVMSASPGFTAVPGFQFRLRASVDTIQEFRVDTASYGADQGTASGGQINLASKAGGAAWHGNLFEYFRNEHLNARNFYDEADASELRLNQFGANGGGPLVKDKLYVFGSLEKMYQRAGVSIFETVPSAQAFEQAVPVTQPLQAALPAGVPISEDLALAHRSAVASQDETSYSARFDYIRSARNRFFLSALSTNGSLDMPDNTVSPRTIAADLRSDHSVLAWDLTTRDWFNQLTFGINRTPSTMSTLPGIDGFQNIRIMIGDPGAGSIGSPGDLTTLPNGDLRSRAEYRGRSYELTDSVTHVRGAHTLKTGLDLRWLRMPFQLGAGEIYHFQNLDGALADEDADVYLLGKLDFHVAAQNQFSAYVLDDWRVRPNLLINLGVRYEYYSPTREVNNHARLFDLNSYTFSAADGGFYTASRLGFNPRIGLAWTPTRLKQNTVIRLGAGVYQGPFALSDTLQPIENDAERLFVQASVFPYSAEAPSDAIRQLPRAMDAAGFQKNLRSYQASVSIQQVLPGKFVAQTAYVGSLNRNLAQVGAANPVTQLNEEGHPLRVNSEFDVIPYMTNGGSSAFHSLQTSLTRRFVDNLTISAAYNWSHSIGNTDGSGDALAPQNPQCLGCERASSSFDVRHTVNVTTVYELPFGPGRRHLNKGLASTLVGNWTASGAWNARTGLPLNVAIQRPDEIFLDSATGAYYSASAQDVPSTAVPVINTPLGGEGRSGLRPNLVAGVDPYTRDSHSGQWLNSAAFSAPLPGTFGNLGRNALRGPGFSQVDVQLSRRFLITEKQSLALRLDVFNVFNHPNFSNPGATLPDALVDLAPGQPYSPSTAAGFGYLGSTVGRTIGLGTSRQLQVGLRYQF